MPEALERLQEFHRAPASRRRPPRLRVLTVTRLFPNRVEPLACAFARQQLGALSRRCSVEVLATIPYLAGSSLFGEWTRPGRLTRVPEREEIDGIPVLHPRVPYLPGVDALPALAPVNAPLYLAGLLPFVARLRDRFDVVLGTYLYPDACAAAALARMLGLPYVIKTHGTDVHLVTKWTSVQSLIASVLRGAAWSIGVSAPMTDALVHLGAPPDRAVLLANGVDRSLFHPIDPREARRALGLPDDGRIMVYVGRLEKEKGLHELCAAFEQIQHMPGAHRPVHLVLVGEGSLAPEIASMAERINTSADDHSGRLILGGGRPLTEVARYLGASDLLVLPSYREGTPNVVLEALASGRPVVATRVGGIPDIIVHGETGILVPPQDTGALTSGILEALARTWDPEILTAAAPSSWDESAAHLHQLLASARHSALQDAA
jgi:glycosyltransferase involved in cell wall biosynthesis